MAGPTAPKWAQAIGLTTRNQALQYQAYALGFDSRADLERARHATIAEGPAAAEAWRKWIVADTQAQIAIDRNQRDAQEKVAKARGLRERVNRHLPPDKQYKSPGR